MITFAPKFIYSLLILQVHRDWLLQLPLFSDREEVPESPQSGWHIQASGIQDAQGTNPRYSQHLPHLHPGQACGSMDLQSPYLPRGYILSRPFLYWEECIKRSLVAEIAIKNLHFYGMYFADLSPSRTKALTFSPRSRSCAHTLEPKKLAAPVTR